MNAYNLRKVLIHGPESLFMVFLVLFLLYIPSSVNAKEICGNYAPRTQCAASSADIGLGQCKINQQCTLDYLGILRQVVPLISLGSSGLPSDLNFSLYFKNDNADNSHALLDIGLGYGWGHSYSTLLFAQRGHMFRLTGDGEVTRYQRGTGNTFTATVGFFESLTQNPDGSFTLTQKDQTRHTFAKLPGDTLFINGPVWRLKDITDRNNNTTKLTYSIGGQLESITATDGRKVIFTYRSGHLQTVKDPLDHVFTLKYDGTSRRLISVTDPDNKMSNYSYNVLNQLTEAVDKNGNKTTIQYKNGKPVSAVDGSGKQILTNSNPISWALDDSKTALTQLCQYVPTRTTKDIPPVATSGDPSGQSQQWRYDYDSHGYLTKITEQNNAATTYTYDLFTLKIASETNVNGQKTFYKYDALGNLIDKTVEKTNVLGFISTFVYEPVFNNVMKVTYPNGSITTYQYDSQGNRTEEIRDLGGLNLLTNWTYYGPNELGNDSSKKGLVKTQTLRNVSPDGNTSFQVSQYKYDQNGYISEVTDPENHTTSYVYDSLGNKRQVTDANGHQIKYDYDNLNRLVKEIDPLGYTTEHTYNNQGNRISVKKQVALSPTAYQTTRYQYDVRNRQVIEIRDPDGLKLTTTTFHDNQNNLIYSSEPNSITTNSFYDAQNHLIKIITGDSNETTKITRMQYDLAGNRTCVIDPNNHHTYFEYDALNRLTKETKKIGTQECTTGDTDDIVTHHYYDVGQPIGSADCNNNTQCSGPMPGSNEISYTVDPEGKYTYFKYDALNRCVMNLKKNGGTSDSRSPKDWTEILQYDSLGNVISKTDANGNAMTYTYNGNNWRISEANALRETTSYGYDSVGNQISETAPNGNITTKEYNERNELKNILDLVGAVATFTYDGIGNRLSEADGNGNKTHYVYDAVNRLVVLEDPLDVKSRRAYDSEGNLIAVVDREANTTCNRYDVFNRLVLTVRKVKPTTGTADCTLVTRVGKVDIDDMWTSTVYDLGDNVLQRISAKKNSNTFMPAVCAGGTPSADCEVTKYAYDEINRLTQEVYPDRTYKSFTYDKAGHTLTRRDPSGGVTQYDYSDLYYLIERTYPANLDIFTYDTGGRMLSAERDGWQVTYEYDDANRLVHTSQNGQPVKYAYDIPNRTRTLTYPRGKLVTEQMDLRDRLDSIDDIFSPTAIVKYTYDAGDRVTNRVYRNGTKASYTYNANDWIVNVVNTKADAGLIAGFGHEYDAEGNKIYEKKQHNSGRSEAYQYDDFNRLIDYKVGTLDLAGTVPSPFTQTQYDLDKLGNWDKKTTTQNANPPVIQTREHNAVNEITQIDTVPILNDSNGNLIQDERFRYDFDEENRLIQVTRRSDFQVVGQYRYDALSRLVTKQLPLFGKEIRYLYDDARIVEEQNASNVTLATYVYGNYIDEILNMERDGQSYYYHQNALWSVAAITNTVGNIVERYSYDAYGYPRITDASGNPLAGVIPGSGIGNTYMFTGRQWNDESGLYSYRARFYDPLKGRFLQRDVKEYEEGMNLYEYMKSNPLNGTDPYGNGWFKKLIKKAVKAVVAVVKEVAKPIKEVINSVGCGTKCSIENGLCGVGISVVCSLLAPPAVLPCIQVAEYLCQALYLKCLAGCV